MKVVESGGAGSNLFVIRRIFLLNICHRILAEVENESFDHERTRVRAVLWTGEAFKTASRRALRPVLWTFVNSERELVSGRPFVFNGWLASFSFRYTSRNANFVLVGVGSGGNLETDSVQECIQVVGDMLVEAVERAALFFGECLVAPEWRQQAGGEGRVDFLEQFQEGHADRIAFADSRCVTSSTAARRWKMRLSQYST